MIAKEKKKILPKKRNVGNICDLTITSLTSNNVGIDESTYPFSIFVPNATLGSLKAKIVKKVGPSARMRIRARAKSDLFRKQFSAEMSGFNPYSYAIATRISENPPLSPSSLSNTSLQDAPQPHGSLPPVKPGDILTVPLTKTNSKGAGIIDYSPSFHIIVPLPQSESFPKTVKLTITRVKANYAFSRLTDEENLSEKKNTKSLSARPFPKVLGAKFTTLLPKKCQIYKSYAILKVKGQILIVKLKKGVLLGESKIRIKIRRDVSNPSYPCTIGQIIQINPISKQQKEKRVLTTLREMVRHEMHFGEKSVKCHPRMKPYIWLKKEDKKKKRPFLKKGYNIINLFKTRRCLRKALNRLTKYAFKGKTFLFIGTKKPATGLVAKASFFTKNSFYVNTRWLGGMLTNWKTICKSISKIRPILKEKQKVVRDILERRHILKAHLIQKAFLFKKRRKLVLTKGRQIVNLFQNQKPEILQFAQKVMEKRALFLTNGLTYLKKRQALEEKRRVFIFKTFLLKEKGLQIASKYQMLLAQLAAYSQKCRDYKSLLALSAELKALQKKNIPLYTVPYSSFKTQDASKASLFKGGKRGIDSIAQNTSSESDAGSEEKDKPWFIPNPPKAILKKIITLSSAAAAASASPSATEVTQYGNGRGMADEKSLRNTRRLRHSKTPKENEMNGTFFPQGNSVVCISLLFRFAQEFHFYIQSVLHSVVSTLHQIQLQCTEAYDKLMRIQKTLHLYDKFKKQCETELKQLKQKACTERQVLNIVQFHLKALDAQKKLLQFLHHIRFYPTDQRKISDIVQILVSKIVDPLLKYPIDNIYEKTLSSTSKKGAAARKKKWQRLEKYFGGIANMTQFSPNQMANTVALIIGQKEEMNAVRECNTLGLKTFTLVDTNCDPTLSQHIIPTNDDSPQSLHYILTQFITRIRLGQKLRLRFQKYKKAQKTASLIS